MKRQYIYYKFERLWHWLQAILIIFLIITGFEIHGSYSVFGFGNVVVWHNFAAWAFIILSVFSIFWHIVTGEWKQYIPTTNKLWAQIVYYSYGIFKGHPNPQHKTVKSKMNPLQRLTYLLLNIILLPILIISGLAYFYFRYSDNGVIKTLDIDLSIIAMIHTTAAYFIIVFLIIHLYLITAGHKITSYLEGMVTGYETIEEESEEKQAENKTVIG